MSSDLRKKSSNVMTEKHNHRPKYGHAPQLWPTTWPMANNQYFWMKSKEFLWTIKSLLLIGFLLSFLVTFSFILSAEFWFRLLLTGGQTLKKRGLFGTWPPNFLQAYVKITLPYIGKGEFYLTHILEISCKKYAKT